MPNNNQIGANAPVKKLTTQRCNGNNAIFPRAQWFAQK